ncbi:hypothetical protein [Streptomyces sp. NBC_01171]|uniref:hypothetical protein n=1 Tax=Streptomyces sp. NBC_01171 TaxID=2903757 RepID=UPI00386C3D4F|nr:hypothetical protein OG448_05275 [Streptomyces sp. NBC_01171]
MTRADQWLSSAPAHWTRGRLKDLISSSANGTWGGDPVEDGNNVRCIRATDFDRVARRADLSNAPLRYVEPSSLRQHLLRPGDLVLEKSGGGEKQPVGMAVLVTDTDAVVSSNFCARIKPSADVDSRFLTYVFAAAYGQGLTQAAIKQTTGIQNLDTQAFFASRWAFPAEEEQRRIADFLDVETPRIDRLIHLQGRTLEKLEEREGAQLDSAVDELVDQWGTVPFRRFLRGVDQGTSPQAEALPAGPDEWGVLKVSCLRPGRFFPDANKRLPSDVEPDVRHEVRTGDLLITRANTPQLVGSTAVVPQTRGKLLLSDKIFRVRLDAGITPEFVAMVARGSRIRGLCSASSNGASQSMANIRFEEIKAWPVPAAALDAQKDVVRRIDRQRLALDEMRALIERQVSLLNERRQALITAAVTGQFDVTTASGRDETEGVSV